MTEYLRLHVFISGKVQGVYYRQNTTTRAQELNISGWIRNLKNGKVEAVFEGEKSNVNKLLEWCYSGPKNAIVSNIEIVNEPFKKEYPNFQILESV